ncbi:hypothetical protein RBI14_22360 [Alcaligenaceae bacterium B3P038]|nr:hypothetical protein [Alcaligenaceae bacterium B3P038]
MEISIESVRANLPHYLTEEQRIALVDALREFPNHRVFYADGFHRDILQGDGWSGLEIFDFGREERTRIQGFLLSNSCDMAPENKRNLPPYFVFAPLLALNSYKALMEGAGVSAEKIQSVLNNIRAQQITNIFYLPASGDHGERFVYLDRLHSLPVAKLTNAEQSGKIFSLNQYAFYLLTMKLSIHFCRLHEGVIRG